MPYTLPAGVTTVYTPVTGVTCLTPLQLVSPRFTHLYLVLPALHHYSWYHHGLHPPAGVSMAYTLQPLSPWLTPSSPCHHGLHLPAGVTVAYTPTADVTMTYTPASGVTMAYILQSVSP